ncbi:MAG: hypothetical protein GXP31_10950 [Kiritimatiellaeota bacterium]|nr:hypothetical protein [Kiritimatiellota bacterium]
MNRFLLGCFGLAFLVCLAADAAEPPTRFRKAHTITFRAEAGQEVRCEIACLRASTGYPDSARYRILSPSGQTVAEGLVEPEKKKTLRFRAGKPGAYIVSVDPGMNAFTIALNVPLWFADISGVRTLNVITHARRLYFRVPRRARSFTLTFYGEPGTATVFDGTGRPVRTVELALYKKAAVVVPVPDGAGGVCWSLGLKLREDQSVVFDPAIPPYIAERSFTDKELERLRAGPGLVFFDQRQTPREALFRQGRTGQPAATLRTEDGLGLAFDKRGHIVAVRDRAADLAPTPNPPVGGFLLRDLKAGETVVALDASVLRRGTGLRLNGIFPNTKISLKADLVAQADHISVRGVVENIAGDDDRAVTLYFALPIRKDGLIWWDDIDHTRPVEGAWEYLTAGRTGVGAVGRTSTYPYGGVSGTIGLTLAIPLDRPCVNRIAYNAGTQQLFTGFDFALTPATKKFPNRAEFAFVVYRNDARWGLRAAIEKYNRIYARITQSRMKRHGGWVCWSTLEPLGDIADFGFLYHWGTSDVVTDKKVGCYSFVYNDSVRFFADLGAFPKRPDHAACQKVFEEYFSAPDPSAFVLSRPKSATGRARYVGLQKRLGEKEAAAYLERAVAAVRESAAYDASGDFIVGYVINRKDWGPANWWTGRVFCDPDPDIPDGYGQFLFRDVLQPAFDAARKKGAELDGVGLDNYFVNARSLDFRRDHFQYVDYPLSFSTDTHKPVLVGDFALFEWVESLAKRMRRQGKYVIANMGVVTFPFAASLLDIHGYEWNIERVGATARTLAFRKPVVTLPVKPEHYEEAWVRNLVPLAFFPGGYGGNSRFAKEPSLRQLYRKYVPIIRALSEAGWEPVTNAACDATGIRIERFGDGRTQPLFFTIKNNSDQPTQCAINLSLKPLSLLLREIRFEMILDGKILERQTTGDAVQLTLQLPARAVSVLKVAAGRSETR